ncbi:cyclin-dependent kinase G-2 [Amborella trichopoda]|uniref:cyclin-dependent kinase G-2 n=1 Tax=Amborella trichopoda TaxID=13333 RepID=UPI0005D3A9B1|nr:cyclin-dependent kinase G-2 [Amborella trichopoda]XP_011623397.1 cyclin-dependent kinase G-2 [Amborella trichopoda]XP_011623399.1 cyclin-dependent kinase G-2 [Amborella trichopoda]XP_011623400.1 cyclin-dependent kinase G-2 [Amborella trichopoda]XP_020523001.1 cyclin-dependent kinase G-2 [Amborella trichopoda]XP_020523002.1 cyclin-dependent kinase G-2 [Amborella trichopoda]XP_020523003.1 cyclin-dependent kinase G-2 [Amborella trichopoda]XP_020523004.1 cyclin-dependent kinase G-2 [Amborella|eukprot:XP_011623396.1 cyclin-dependent kinase G-2 [Amborella trichopoda]
MAASRNGGHRDSDYRPRDLEVSRRRDPLSYTKEDKFRQKTRDSGRDSGQNRMEKARVSCRDNDREPGELSSGSASSEERIQVAENGASSNGRKRKFSPITWDEVVKPAGNFHRKIPTAVALSESGLFSGDSEVLPPPPPLPHGLPLKVPSGTLAFQPDSSELMIKKSSPGFRVVRAHDSHTEHSVRVTDSLYEREIRVSDGVDREDSQSDREIRVLEGSDRTDSFQIERESRVSNGDVAFDREPGQLVESPVHKYEEEEEYMPARNISASRWADNSYLFPHGEVSEDEGEIRWGNKPASPEAGELVGDGSDGSQPKSASIERETRNSQRSTSGDEEERDRNDDPMEIDENHTEHGSGLDTESEDEERPTTPLRPIPPPTRTINMLQGCRSVDEFQRLNRIDEGTYGVVYRAKDKKTGEIVALKKVKMEKEREGFPLTSLREINILLSFHHPSIVDVKEVVVGSNLDSIFMVMEYMDHDLKGLMETKKEPFSQSEVKCLMLQLLEGVKYLHDNWVLHRDLKTSNLLLNNKGDLKICDFGLARQYGSPLKPYTQLVVTLWYRAPELLLGAKEYSTAIDMWSLGCIMAELLSKEPLFNGKSEIDQLDKIFRVLGTPNAKRWPGFAQLPGVKCNFVQQPYNKLRDKFPPTSFTGRPMLSEAGLDLLNRLLEYDPEKRITAEAALQHEWFREVPLPQTKEFMPTYPPQHAHDRRLRRVMKSPDPLEEQRRKELQQRELGTRVASGVRCVQCTTTCR